MKHRLAPRTKIATLLAALALASASFTAHAAVLASDDFETGHTTGDLNGQTAQGTGLTGNWSAAAAFDIGAGLEGSSGIVLDRTSFSSTLFATANLATAADNVDGVWYMSGLVKGSGTNLALFGVGLTDRGNITIGVSGGNYAIRQGSTTNVFGTYTPDATVFLVAKLINGAEASGADRVELWINPAGPEGPADFSQTVSIFNATKVDQIVAGGGVSGFPAADDIVVGTTWDDVIPEPGSLALLGLGGLCLLGRGRRASA